MCDCLTAARYRKCHLEEMLSEPGYVTTIALNKILNCFKSLEIKCD